MRQAMSLLVVCLYCFPFVYFSMYQDFFNQSIMGYVTMVLMTTLLAFVGKRSGHILIPIAGNVLSFVISYYMIGLLSDNYIWNVYFKPLTPFGLLVLISVLNLLLQFLAIRLVDRLRFKI